MLYKVREVKWSIMNKFTRDTPVWMQGMKLHILHATFYTQHFNDLLSFYQINQICIKHLNAPNNIHMPSWEAVP